MGVVLYIFMEECHKPFVFMVIGLKDVESPRVIHRGN